MLTRKTLSLQSIFAFTGRSLWWLTGWVTLVVLVFHVTRCPLLAIPWLPISLIGVAVAFYVGFKNNHSYDRLWDAVQLWTDIANNSRKMVTKINHYHSEEPGATDSTALRKQLVYRHIAWLYLLRRQLLEPAPWEHVGALNRRRRAQLQSFFHDELGSLAHQRYLSAEEYRQLEVVRNQAAQLLDMQTRTIQELYKRKALNMLQQVELQAAIGAFCDGQGHAERIKLIPFPRKYASFSFVFVCIFLFLLPFGIIDAFSSMGDAGLWLCIPAGVIVGWVYLAMEMTGDYSENPFEGLYNDVPMLSLCRTIEIDMLQMIGEREVPAPVLPKKHVLI